MPPSRKSRTVNKRYSHINDVAQNKDGENAHHIRPRKKKLSDMLGPKWSKKELERFYEAYRKYGKDWKKVAAIVRNRSVEMVDALYMMNRAYLSLPEGTASVAGLIAMMTDHYCVLEVSDSEPESSDGTGASRKHQKRGRGKYLHGTSKGLSGHFPDQQSQAVASSYDCLSLLKKRRSSGSRPPVVGKRTPRIPVSYLCDKDTNKKFFSPTRQGLKLKAVANDGDDDDDADDDDVAHEIALALTEASQRGGSPQVSQTPKRKRENVVHLTVSNGEKMGSQLAMPRAKRHCSELEKASFEESPESMEADTGDYVRYKSYLADKEGVGTVDAQRKGKKFYVKKPEVEDSGNNLLDDIKEACSGTEEEQKIGAVKGKLETETKSLRSKGPRKRSKKLVFGGDESSAFDALQTLADLSLMMPMETIDAESSARVMEEKVDVADKSRYLEVSGNGPSIDASSVPEEKEGLNESISGVRKRKPKTFPFEVIDNVKGSVSKGKRSSHNVAHLKQGKSLKPPEGSSSSTDHRREGNESVVSNAHVPCENQVSLPTKVRNRRKMNLQKPLNRTDVKTSDSIAIDQPNVPIPPFHERALDLKGKLSNCLSWYRIRRWCTFEWFYSAIDYPWFAKREFVEYLDHVGLGHISRLTRAEWSVIRSSLGKPRRFSEHFLKEEKEKLNHYRDSVRTHYTKLREGTGEGLPADLARPLSVGQRVIAIHPKTREIYDGSVLTVDRDRCRIQFDQRELGVEFVMDIDCMPLNPLENMPVSLTRHNVKGHKFFENFNELKMNGHLKDRKLEGCIKFAPIENREYTNGPSHISQSPTGNLLKQQINVNSQATVGPSEAVKAQQTEDSQYSLLVQIQAKEADVQALSELTRALEKKEAIVCELRNMNDEVLDSQKDGENSLKDSEPFKKQYAAVLLQLSEANEQVSSALFSLRQRNTYHGNSALSSIKPTASVVDPGGGISNTSDPSSCQDLTLGPHLEEIVESSRVTARAMVDSAVQALMVFKKTGNSVERIDEAVDYVTSHISMDPMDQVNNASDQNEIEIPSDLITNCIATVLMIQKCTQRQFPPAEVAQILDSAVTSLQSAPQNLPIYGEIQKYMGIIRSQILALVPS